MFGFGGVVAVFAAKLKAVVAVKVVDFIEVVGECGEVGAVSVVFSRVVSPSCCSMVSVSWVCWFNGGTFIEASRGVDVAAIIKSVL